MKNMYNIDEKNTQLKEILQEIRQVTRETTYDSMEIILDTERKAEHFKDYVKKMNNKWLELDCLTYRQLILDNRKYNINTIKIKLKQLTKDDDYIVIHKELKHMLLENITELELKEFLKETKEDNMFIDNFLDLWNEKKGVAFKNLLELYKLSQEQNIKKVVS